MLRNTLIALAATAAIGFGFASSAEAKTNVNLNFGLGLGLGVFGGGYYPAGGAVYVGGADYADNGCYYATVKHKKFRADGSIKVWFSNQLVCD